MLRQPSPRTAVKRRNTIRCIQRRFLVIIGFIAVIQLLYFIWFVAFEKRFIHINSDTSLDVFQAEVRKPETQTCIFREPLNPQNITEAYNQTLKILQEYDNDYGLYIISILQIACIYKFCFLSAAFNVSREVFFSYALVFILCPDSHSEEVSIVTYAQYDWAKTFISPDNFWGDIYFYTNILENLLVAANYTTEWIGSMPGRLSYKDVNDMNVIWMHRMLSDTSLIEDGVEVLVFEDSAALNQTGQDLSWDPLWIDLTDWTLEYMGERPTNATTLIHFITHHHQAFRGMSFVARPEPILHFIQWIRTVIEYFRSDVRVLQLSKRASCDELQSIIQLYISHFLIPYFFISKSSQIITMSEYKNSERSETFRVNDNFASEVNNNIKEIITSEPSGIDQLYVLCHSKQSCNHASQQFSYYSWGQHLYFMPSTNLLETYFYTNVIENLMAKSTHSPNWIGSISWKALKKTYVNVIDQMLSDTTLVDEGFDVLGFWTPSEFDPHYCNSTMHIQSNSAHTGLIEFIQYILEGINESDEHISLIRQAYPTFKSFYGSYFVARPAFMQEYINWIRRVMVFIAKDPVARTYVWSDSHYRGDASVPLKVYGVEFYPLHPFVGERLLQYFFNSRNAKIFLLFEYMEKNGIKSGYYYYQCGWWMDVNYN